MALGTALSSVLAIPNLKENEVKDINILMSVMKTKKTKFTRLVGSEDGELSGLLIPMMLHPL